MAKRPTYEELEQKVKELEIAEAEREQAEVALQESEEKFSKVFLSSPDSITVTTLREGIIVDVNEGFEKLSGYRRNDVVGKSTTEIELGLKPEDNTDIRDMLLRDGYVKDYEVELNDRSGEIRFVSWSIELLKLGGKTHAVAVGRDITERKQAENAVKESEEKYRLIFDKAAEGILVIQEGRITFVNRRMLHIIGYTPEDIGRLYNESFLTFVHPEDREMVLDNYSKRIQGLELPSTYSIRLKKLEDKPIWVDLSASAISWEGKPAILFRSKTQMVEEEAAAVISGALGQELYQKP